MSDIIELDDYRDHIVIEFDGGVHVLPVQLVEFIAQGKHDPDPEMIQLIARALLDYIYAD